MLEKTVSGKSIGNGMDTPYLPYFNAFYRAFGIFALFSLFCSRGAFLQKPGIDPNQKKLPDFSRSFFGIDYWLDRA